MRANSRIVKTIHMDDKKFLTTVANVKEVHKRKTTAKNLNKGVRK